MIDGDYQPTLFEGEGRSSGAYPLPAKLLKIKKIQGWDRVAFTVGSTVYFDSNPTRSGGRLKAISARKDVKQC